MVVIVDYGMGNIGSILNMVKKVGFNAKVSSSIDDLSTATKIILPGVGAFDKGVSNLQKLDLMDVLKEKALKEKIPILGICLGMLMEKIGRSSLLKKQLPIHCLTRLVFEGQTVCLSILQVVMI